MPILTWLSRANSTEIFQKSLLFYKFYFKSIIQVTLAIQIPAQLIIFLSQYLIERTGTLGLVGWTLFIIFSFGGQLFLSAALIFFSLERCYNPNEEFLSFSELLKNATHFIAPFLKFYGLIFMYILFFATLLSLLATLFTGDNPAVLQSAQIVFFFLILFIFLPRFFLAPFYLVEESIPVILAMQRSKILYQIEKTKVLGIFSSYVLLNSVPVLLSVMVLPLAGIFVTVFLTPFLVLLQVFLYLDLRIQKGELTLENKEQDPETV
ncbi:hypothetical protein KAH55_03860 [bacterium]|nr:hypothetical protein [bacterium]